MRSFVLFPQKPQILMEINFFNKKENYWAKFRLEQQLNIRGYST